MSGGRQAVRGAVEAACRALGSVGVAARPETLRRAKLGRGGEAEREELSLASARLALLVLVARRGGGVRAEDAAGVASAAEKEDALPLLARVGAPPALLERAASPAEGTGCRALFVLLAWLSSLPEGDVFAMWRRVVRRTCPLDPAAAAAEKALPPPLALPPPPPLARDREAGVRHRADLALQVFRRAAAGAHRLADAHACRARMAAAAERAQGLEDAPLPAADLALAHAARRHRREIGARAAALRAWAADARECARAERHRALWFRWARSAVAAEEDRAAEAGEDEDDDDDEGDERLYVPQPAQYGPDLEAWLGEPPDEEWEEPQHEAGSLARVALGPPTGRPVACGSGNVQEEVAAARAELDESLARLNELRHHHHAALEQFLVRNAETLRDLRLYQ